MLPSLFARVGIQQSFSDGIVNKCQSSHILRGRHISQCSSRPGHPALYGKLSYNTGIASLRGNWVDDKIYLQQRRQLFLLYIHSIFSLDIFYLFTL